jgi:hypothetical protein
MALIPRESGRRRFISFLGFPIFSFMSDTSTITICIRNVRERRCCLEHSQRQWYDPQWFPGIQLGTSIPLLPFLCSSQIHLQRCRVPLPRLAPGLCDLGWWYVDMYSVGSSRPGEFERPLHSRLKRHDAFTAYDGSLSIYKAWYYPLYSNGKYERP